MDVDLSSPRVMTILNVTPDSFFEGSRRTTLSDIECAVERALEDGAQIIDVGGYSSRPGAEPVSEQQEYERVAQGVGAVRRLSKGVAVSVDTFRASVARRVLDEFGECIINDISSGELDPEILDVVAEYKVPYIAMHMRATPSTMQQHTDYDDVTGEVIAYFDARISYLNSRGIRNIIIDPGFGFAKTTWQNYRLLKDLSRFKEFGLPILAGISRKSMIYRVLECEPKDALNGTTALHWEALRAGATILRVHDTKEAAQTVKLFNYYCKA